MPKDDANSSGHLQELNEQIYKHSFELAAVNKTLSLLRKLYQISLLSLDPAAISEQISETVRVDLNMEMVGVFLVDEENKSLNPFKFSQSERLTQTLEKQKVNLSEVKVNNFTTHKQLKQVIVDKSPSTDGTILDIWDKELDKTVLTKISEESHLKTVLLYPLTTQDQIIGMLLMGLNRDYSALSVFEKDSIKSLIDVVAVALDKALLYVKLQEANEQLKALDKARTEFISIASHQLRTPPSTIKWYLGAILNGDFGVLPDDLKAALARTNVTNEAQIATIDDLLNASRIERGKLEFFFEVNDLETVVSAIVEQMIPLAEMKKLALEYTKPSVPLPKILMDKEKVRQVINNMIDNAIKYSKTGTIKVSLKQEGEDLVVKVKDNGKGISKDELLTIFDKYSRGHDSVTHATGLGLGMYVAKVIVEQHNGKIWAESEGVGKGSTFCFSLPIHSDLKATTVDLVQPAN